MIILEKLNIGEKESGEAKACRGKSVFLKGYY